MNSQRKTAITIGVLFIIATVFLFIGETFYKPILSSPDYLDITYPNRIVVIIGILLEFTCVLAIPLIPVFFYPILKKHNEVLALGYVVFRSFEFVLLSFSEINKLSLIGLSREYLSEGGADTSSFQYIGSSIQAQNYWSDTAGLIYNIVFVLGALMLYTVLYKSRLIPRWISIWGFLAAGTLFIGGMLSIFSDISPVIIILIISPIAVQEMVMAVWLIVKGLRSPTLGAKTT